MAMKKYKPTSPGRRFQTRMVRESGTKNEPHKPLLKKLHKHGGRDSAGRLSVRHRGGGHKRTYRMVDFISPFTIQFEILHGPVGIFQHMTRQ